MAQIADGYVLADMQVEIAAARRQNEGAGNRRSPDDLAVDQAPDVLEDRVAVISGFAQSRIGIGAQQDGVGTIDADETQLTEPLGDGVRVVADVGRKRHDRIAGSLADAGDARSRITFEDRPVLREGQKSRGILGGLPIQIVGAAFHVIDLLAVNVERDPELDERIDHALSRQNAVRWRRDVAQVAGADGGERDTAGTVYVNDTPAGEMAFESARCLFLDLRPGRIGYRGEPAVKIVHEAGSPLSDPMPSEPSRAGAGAAALVSGTRFASDRSVVSDVVEKGRRWNEEQVAGFGKAEIQQAVIVAGRAADEHVLQHLLDGPGRTRVTDEIGAELAVGDAAERHVVAHDLNLLAVFDDSGQRIVGRCRFNRVVELDVGKLGPADNALLRLRGQRVPSANVVQVFLHDHVAAAGECQVFCADIDGFDGLLGRRVFRAVNEADEVAVVEIAKAMDFINRRDRVAEPGHDLGRQLEAEVHAPGANVEEEIAGRGDRMARAGLDLAKGMQLRRPRLAKEAIPRVRANSHDARKICFNVAEADGADQCREVAAERPHGRATVLGRPDRRNQKDGRAS